ELGDVAFLVAGMNKSRRILSLRGNGVDFLGRREEVTSLYDGARVFVAPTRFGAGIPLKIQEAAAHGVPVVTTSLMRKQLGWEEGVDLLTADDAPAFARRCAELYGDARL